MEKVKKLAQIKEDLYASRNCNFEKVLKLLNCVDVEFLRDRLLSDVINAIDDEITFKVTEYDNEILEIKQGRY